MKKILLFLFLFIPFYVSATVENYYMEATVLKNGDISVKEVFSLDGSYNGFNRELYYGNNIYGGSGIEVVSVRGISESKLDGFNTLDASGDLFKLVGILITLFLLFKYDTTSLTLTSPLSKIVTSI